jgi:EXS family
MYSQEVSFITYTAFYCLLSHMLHADWALVEPAVTRHSSSSNGCTSNAFTSSNRYSTVCGYRLRSKRLYPHTWLYIAAAAVNLVLRFCWTVTIVPENVRHNSSAGGSYLFSKDFQMYMSPFVAAAEIVRRSLWGVLRVEAEHIALFCTDTTATANSSISNSTANGIHSGSSSNAAIDFEQGLADQPYTKMHTTTRAAEYRSSSSGSSNWQHSSSSSCSTVAVGYCLSLSCTLC